MIEGLVIQGARVKEENKRQFPTRRVGETWKPDLFVIDEGFGTLDSENINHMNMLLGYLKSKFDNVLIISHIESMQDITNNVINITKNQKGYSSVKIM